MNNSFFIRRILLLVTSVLTGCAGISYDQTNSAVASNLVTGCYQTNTEAAIYRFAADNRPPSSKGSFLIQTGLPTNEWQFTGYGSFWKKVVDIPVGTRLRVTSVFNQSWGSQGRYWLIYGRLVGSKLSAEEFVIPSGNYAITGQLWIAPTSPDQDNTQIRFREYFVRHCNLTQ